MQLTGAQVKALNEFMGGDYDTDVTIEHCADRRDVVTGEPMPAGLYAWCTEYPDEGCVLLT